MMDKSKDELILGHYNKESHWLDRIIDDHYWVEKIASSNAIIQTIKIMIKRIEELEDKINKLENDKK